MLANFEKGKKTTYVISTKSTLACEFAKLQGFKN
jgi:hypothetical protein